MAILDKSVYVLGINRYLKVLVEDGDTMVKIYEDMTHKSVEFTSLRWAQFVRIFDQIDEAVLHRTSEQFIRFRQHIGGKLYVSVSAEYPCVDLRMFYLHRQHGPRPSYNGIALRLKEWSTLKELLPQIRKDHVVLSSTSTCSDSLSHSNQESAFDCTECYPFGFINE